MKNQLYVAYGSNLNMRQMAMRCPTAKLIGTGSIENYELQFKGRPTTAFATIAPKKGASVPVAVWQIKPKDERSLDIYEGYPSHYYKEDIPVELTKDHNGNPISDKVNAMVYIMDPRMNFGVPSQRYYNTVYEGYEDCGLNIKVLNDAVDESIEKYRAIQQIDDKFSDFTNENNMDGNEYSQLSLDDDIGTDENINENDPFDFSNQLNM